jgi:hypothetical protein
MAKMDWDRDRRNRAAQRGELGQPAGSGRRRTLDYGQREPLEQQEHRWENARQGKSGRTRSHRPSADGLGACFATSEAAKAVLKAERRAKAKKAHVGGNGAGGGLHMAGLFHRAGRRWL